MHKAPSPDPRADIKPLLVAAAIILRNEPAAPAGTTTKILIAQRKADASAEGGKWEFPGGKVDPFEHPEATVVREIKEELDLDITVDRIFDVASHVYDHPTKGPGQIILICYLCGADSADFKLLDVADAKWVTVHELDRFQFAEADIGTVAKLKSYLAD